jgi:DNA-binding response OmpR family regulator
MTLQPGEDRAVTSPDEIPSSANTLAGVTLVDDELAARAAREILSPSSRGTILVVEPEAGSPAAKQLEAAGFSVKLTPDGVVGSQYLATMKFDAVVSDVHVGGLGGIDLLRYAHEHDRDIPVLLMTGAPDVESAAAAVEHGAFQYLLKPLPAGRLVDAVDKAVRACAAARARSRALEAILDDPTQDTQAHLDKSRWDNALSTLWMAYQPIVLPSESSTPTRRSCAATSRRCAAPGSCSTWPSRCTSLVALGGAPRARAEGRLVRRRAAGSHYVFVNLHADDLLDEMPHLARARRCRTSRHGRRARDHRARRAARHRRGEGEDGRAAVAWAFAMALDDLGAGYAGLTSFAHLRPEMVKLDMALVRDIDEDPVKRKLVASRGIDVSRDIGTLVVGEGVETEAERDTLMQLGCNLLQGYLFGKPKRL